jgi:hypothetical protein
VGHTNTREISLIEMAMQRLESEMPKAVPVHRPALDQEAAWLSDSSCVEISHLGPAPITDKVANPSDVRTFSRHEMLSAVVLASLLGAALALLISIPKKSRSAFQAAQKEFIVAHAAAVSAPVSIQTGPATAASIDDTEPRVRALLRQ